MIIYRCYKKDRSACGCQEPCEYCDAEMNKRAYRSTPCDFGEEDCFMETDPYNEFFLLVVGTRTYNDYKFFSGKMDIALSRKNPDDIIIVSGGAKGVDAMAERYAKKHHYRFLCFPADWSKGKKAGPERNRQMHAYIAKHSNRGVLAFWDGKSRGTAGSFALAEEFGNEMKVVRI